MKAAVLHAPRQPMTIEEVAIEKPKRREVLVRTAAAGPVPQRPALHRGRLPDAGAGGARPRVGRRRRGGRRGRHLRQARRPRHLVPVGVLRPLRVLPQRPPLDLPDAGGEDAAGRRQAADLAGPAPQPVPQPVVVRRADGRARARAREDPRRHAARPRQPDRLQRDHRLRRRRPHGADRARRDASPCSAPAASAWRRSTPRRSPAPARIIAIDKDPFKLDLARKFGATDVVDASEGDTVKRVVELTGGGVHYSFEASASRRPPSRASRRCARAARRR